MANMIKNARIHSTELGWPRKDKGPHIFSCSLYLSLEMYSIGYGWHCLLGKDSKSPSGTAICSLEIIAAILETLDVDNWEALPGTFIRVKNENFGPILGIGHLIRDQWFSFERFFKSRKPEIWSTYRQQDFIEEDEHRP